VSDIAYNLRKEVQTMQASLNALAKTNSSLKPLCSQVRQLYSVLYSNEQELNRRNVTLRTYIGSNFGSDEYQWNQRIEQRARERRAQGA
jgi:predicted  nucleic acid-binding Zn-ribbon protein